MVRLNALVDSLNVGGLEWWATGQQRVQDDADGPDVHLKAVAKLFVENLRCDIIWSAAECLLALAVEGQLCCEAKVADLDGHVGSEEKVCELQVAVNDVVGMQVFYSRYSLQQVSIATPTDEQGT